MQKNGGVFRQAIKHKDKRCWKVYFEYKDSKDGQVYQGSNIVHFNERLTNVIGYAKSRIWEKLIYNDILFEWCYLTGVEQYD